MTEFSDVIVFDLIFRPFAVYYLAVAAVDFFNWIPWTKMKHTVAGHEKRRVLNRKPFNCELCMLFWMALPVAFLPFIYSFPPALAGIGLVLFKITKRLEIFGV